MDGKKKRFLAQVSAECREAFENWWGITNESQRVTIWQSIRKSENSMLTVGNMEIEVRIMLRFIQKRETLETGNSITVILSDF